MLFFMDRRIWIVVGILALVALGFFFFSTMTGNEITGTAVAPIEISSDYYKISDFGGEVESSGEGSVVREVEDK